MYHAIVLTQRSQNELLYKFSEIIPEDNDWIIKAHHVTIGMGEVPEEYQDYLGEQIPITITGYGVNNRVMAVSVDIDHDTLQSKNAVPHITLCVNTGEGAKPKESNDIQDWRPAKNNFTLEGIYKQL